MRTFRRTILSSSVSRTLIAWPWWSFRTLFTVYRFTLHNIPKHSNPCQINMPTTVNLKYANTCWTFHLTIICPSSYASWSVSWLLPPCFFLQSMLFLFTAHHLLVWSNLTACFCALYSHLILGFLVSLLLLQFIWNSVVKYP